MKDQAAAMGLLKHSEAQSPPAAADLIEEGKLGDDRTPVTQSPLEESPASSFLSSAFWVTVNIVATVFVNKAIFSDPSLRHCQLTFALFHFLVTWLTLHLLSKPPLALFVPRRAAIGQMIPLAMAMCLNVIIPNMSLAYSPVVFYQLTRMLVTPTVWLLNALLYKEHLPVLAALAIIQVGLGVSMFTLSEMSRENDEADREVPASRAILACIGAIASALYTICIARYHRNLRMSSMQLLYNQTPIASFLLLYVIPFIDVFPGQGAVAVPVNRWLLIGLSGVLASMINISQFYIVAQTGPVSSTMVGHAKTCIIMALGWVLSGREVDCQSVVGVLIALGGTMSYSSAMATAEMF